MVAPAPSSSSALWLARGILLAAIVWTYAPSLRFAPISLDDAGQLAAAADQQLSQIWEVDRYGHFRPIKSALFWLWAHGPTDWGSVRAVLLAVFVLSTVLVERLAARVSGSPMQGLLIAACWALHPVMPAAVAWLSAVHVVLCLVGLLIYLECAQRSLDATPARSYRWLAIALVSLGVSLMTHQLAVLAPVLLWLLLQQNNAPRTSSPRIVYASSAVLIALWLAITLATSSLLAQYRSAEQSGWPMSASAARYVWQHALWWLSPAGHFGVLLTDRPEAHLLASALAWLALLGACALCWKLRRRDPVLVFGLAWFLITLAPYANFLPVGNTPLGMHYIAVPGVGLSIALVRALAVLIERVASARPSAARALPWVLTAALAAHWLPTTARAVAAFGDEEQLFAQTVANHPDQIEALVNLASAQLARGRYEVAAATLERAQRLAPENIGVVHNQFSLRWQTGAFAEALALLDSHPRIAARPEFQLARGQTLIRLGHHAEAIAPLQTAFDSKSTAISPEQRFVGGTQLLLVLLQSDRPADAERFYRRLLVEYPEREELRAMESMWRR
jgi:hypothetical protein